MGAKEEGLVPVKPDGDGEKQEQGEHLAGGKPGERRHLENRVRGEKSLCSHALGRAGVYLRRR